MKTKPSADAKRVAALLRKSLLRQAKKHPNPEAPFLPTGYTEDATGFRLNFQTEQPPAPVATADANPASLTLRTHQVCDQLRTLANATALRMAIDVATEQLAALAASGDRKAVESLAMVGAHSASKLEQLARAKPALVRSVASALPWWPVLLSPHKENQAEQIALLDDLKVATATPERMRGRWRNAETPTKTKKGFRHVNGKYVVWIGQTLRLVHANRPLREAVRRDAGGIVAAKHTAGIDISPAWPKWVADAVALEPLTRATAPAWFKVGWKMLLALTGGDVTTIQGLRPVGQSNADFQKDLKRSERIQESQRQQGIRKALRLAFLERFGN